ncbi:hypothetical protein ACFQ9Z_37105 [Streptomyces sp. NPDC056580]|uniref:hypothetical protein n=1 Tax=Streptomyces sp. NPDC056580 TaxID=3345872 RepID=UPI0036B01FE7
MPASSQVVATLLPVPLPPVPLPPVPLPPVPLPPVPLPPVPVASTPVVSAPVVSTPVVSAVVEPASMAPVDVVPYGGPRIAAADFFTRARRGRAVTALPVFRDGDCVLCPRGTEWMRRSGRWIAPGQPDGVFLTDGEVTGWWRTRMMPGSRFTLVRRLTPTETRRIPGDRYLSRVRCLSLRKGAFTYDEEVCGD